MVKGELMKFHDTKLPGVIVIEPLRHKDKRGYFLETYKASEYKKYGICEDFVQQNHSHSLSKNILRGLHFQIKRPQAQLITVFNGSVFDVVVDIRPKSKTFGQWYGIELGTMLAVNQIYMAPGFAHGFYVTSDTADVHYAVSREYDHDDEGGINWADPELRITWPASNPIINDRDNSYPLLHSLSVEELPHNPPIEN